MSRWLLSTLLLLSVAVVAAAEEGETLTRETCAACHEEAEAFAAGPHGRAMAARSAETLDRSCVTCHGPADAHVEDPMAENIHRWPTDEACITCHAERGATLDLTTPAHRRQQVACLDCHAEGHDDPGTDHMLASAPADLCASCHRSEAAAFEQPFSHREGTRPMDCTSCHSLHGTTRVGRLLSLERGGACLDCHSEKAGPFVFPHPPRALEGCLDCHQPHGSTNPRMLTRRTEVSLCLECHAGIPTLHDLTQARFRACVSCHSAVHGSNRSPRLFDD